MSSAGARALLPPRQQSTSLGRRGAATAAGLALGSLADLLLADPRRGHPVAGFGQAAGALERRTWRDHRAAGVAYAAVCVGTAAAVGTAGQRLTAGRPLARTALTAAATWAVLGGTSLGRAATTMEQHLAAGDLAAARAHLPTLAGRDPRGLDEPALVRATVESVAENTSDAAVAPLFWGAVAGLPGLLAYRAANTLDAMVGYRSARHLRFGWAAARLDDVLNWLPARTTAALTVLTAPLVGASPAGAWRAWQRDGAAHPSPNAGRCEAALAGALGVRLGGRNAYGERVEERPGLGDGQPPVRGDIRRAVRLSRAVWTAAAVLATAARLARRG
ncbi:Cobalamin biosynthetic protein (anaerobic pathway of cobalamin biosynthesis, cobD) [Modestobacter italicus]|uniref:Cobalamin biosynthesis protein CobD n=1 Tax=Modestobacter italicus (strain DSM 44449 / CECT 9708 / BC 501) TaxID=2732864 RepID=I4ERT6_MODI5|nr:cobalamin biosynthesis protein [Modestobacter marinus]CCH86099.1 Cobalamin biosynthetic protein (anaerobic pathway of cobalamin biosynthesis, cobD) [Modestobacter marinus]